MSADNGIYVLPVEERGETLYFVAYAGAIENIYWQPDRPDGYSTEYLRAYFGDARSFKNKGDALIFAHTEADDYQILEYGVQVLETAKGTFLLDKVKRV